MRIKVFKFAVAVCLLIVMPIVAMAVNSDGTVQKLYSSAQKHVIDREWDKAIDLYQQLIDDYPDNEMADDARFWVGYCLENKKDNRRMLFLLLINWLKTALPVHGWMMPLSTKSQLQRILQGGDKRNIFHFWKKS